MTTGPTALNFGSPLWLWALGLLPVLGGMFVWAERRARRRLEILIGNPRLRGQLTGAASVGRRRARFALMLAGLAGLVGALAGPQMGYETRETHRRGLDLVLAVDVSKSMLATDVLPDRLRRAKLSIQDLVGALDGDRAGLVAFAGSAFLQAPLTIDYDAVLNAAAELDTNLIPLGGTNIGAAIDLALEAFGKAEAGNRAIVLFSDGEPTSDTEQASGVQAAGRAAAAGVKVFTVGIGTPEGSLIPLNGNGGEFVQDAEGKIVRTRLDESNLRELAKAGNGFYLRFVSGEETTRELVAQGLSQLKTGEIDARTDRRPIERYQWPLGAGLVFLGMAAAVRERRKTSPRPLGKKAGRPPVVPTRTVGRSPAPAATLLGVVFWTGVVTCHSAAADLPSRPDASPGAPDSGALELYRRGRYDEAYQAFEELARKNPGVGSLEFNAGASAYMGKQYDEALDAFGHALTADDADLRAKSHYNFGNALFRRGEEQKDREAKLKDWKNAVQHYNSTLDMLKTTHGGDKPLAGNTAYNRDLVQKRIDEELKQPPPPPSKQPSSPQQKQDQKDQPPPSDPKRPQDQGQGPSDQQNKDQQAGGQDRQDGQPPPSPSPSPSSSAQPRPQGKDGNQPSKPGDKSSPPGQTPDPASLPRQDQPRRRGEFQSHADATPGPVETPAEPAEEAGKMSPAQARALLDALKGEDQPVQLNGKPGQPKPYDEPVIKDW